MRSKQHRFFVKVSSRIINFYPSFRKHARRTPPWRRSPCRFAKAWVKSMAMVKTNNFGRFLTNKRKIEPLQSPILNFREIYMRFNLYHRYNAVKVKKWGMQYNKLKIIKTTIIERINAAHQYQNIRISSCNFIAKNTRPLLLSLFLLLTVPCNMALSANQHWLCPVLLSKNQNNECMYKDSWN